MNNGNGKTNPTLITAQQATEAAVKPLRDAEKRAATTRLRLAEAEQVLALAQQDNERTAERFLDDNSPANKKALIESNADVDAARSRVEGFKRKLATEEAAIEPLFAAHNEAMVALAQIQLDANLSHLEEEWSAARHAVTEHEAQTAKLRQAEAEAERRYKTLAAQRREGEWAQTRRQALANARKINGPLPVERVRVGF